MNDFATLDRWIASLKAIPAMAADAATTCASAALEAMRAPLNAGQSPDGEAWAPRKKDGGRAYANAAASLAVRAAGTILRFTITRKEDLLGHIGVRGAPARRMLPLSIPKAVSDAIRARLGQEFSRIMNGGR